MLERHADGTVNFAAPRVLISSSGSNPVTRSDLKEAIRELFKDDSDIALLYRGTRLFRRHGWFTSVRATVQNGDGGVSFAEVMSLANASPAKKIKLLFPDSCQWRSSGTVPDVQGMLRRYVMGPTILTASKAGQTAQEINGSGVFTSAPS